MNKLYSTFIFLILSILLFNRPVSAQPAGFIDQEYVGGFAQAVGLTFDDNGRMYVWEKGGKIWIVENGVKLPNPLLDISEEVGNWRDFGLLGVALDPNFLANGYIYLLYIVDRHHLLYYGTGNYNPNTNEYFDATIGRITRYQAEASTSFTTVDYSTRNVLVGETASDGFPNLHQSHGTASIVFGTDGSLLAGFGDGASYNSTDEGSAGETYWQQAIADGIITPAQNVGAYRSQQLSILSGKVIRINPETGDGYPSNPYYQSSNPSSPASRIWASGLRNPCRMVLHPGSGSHDPANGDPGDIYIGDVGWGNREELNVMDQGGLNFGWPKYEGMTHTPGYNNPAFEPDFHELPKVDWRTGNARAYVNGNIYDVGSAQVPGPSFEGNCSIGGVWYHAQDFPSQYHDTYFHADYGGDWIRNFRFDANNNCLEVRDFKEGADAIVFVATDPNNGGLYYIGGGAGNSNNNENSIRRISYTGGNLPPIVSASADVLYGSSPLTVQFTGELSYDPSGDPITFEWNFGDGSPLSNEINPQHTYTSGSGQPESFTATLTVTDDNNLSEQISITISLNNTPPQILSTSIDNTDSYSVISPDILNLNAVVNDAEHGNNLLTYEWYTELHHNNHFHPEPADNNPVTTTELSTVGCDGATYFYRIRLVVSDPAGLSSSFAKDIYPDCSGNTQTISFTAVPDKLTIDAPFDVNATASSGLPVIFHIIQGPAIISGNTITVTGNPGEVTVRAIQSGNNTYAPAIPIEHTFTVSPPGGTGLNGNYYNNMDFTNPALSRIDGTIDFDWGTGPPDPSMGANTFSIRWEGSILPVYSETYTFTTTTDDGVRLWINNQLIIDEWIDQSPTAHSANISLTAGAQVPVVMEFYENGGGAVAQLEWSSSSQNQQIVPQFLLFPDAPPVDNTPPSVVLSTVSNDVTAPFEVVASFDETITGLTLNDFQLSNGTASDLSNVGFDYYFTVEPVAEGIVSIDLPANSVQDLAGNDNTASNTLIVNYTIPEGCNNPVNIALNKNAGHSSDYGNGAGPELAVDGNTSGNWWGDFSVSSTSWGNQPWWEVDLGSISTINEINVWNRTDCCGEFLSDYYVFVSDVPFVSTDLNETINQPGVSSYHETTQAGEPTTITIGRTGRYVRIQNSGTGFMTLAEVEVIGCEGGGGGGDTTPPDVTLSTNSNNVTAAFAVDVDFNENITGLDLSDFAITNGTGTNLSGNGLSYIFTVIPNAEGLVTIELPANTVTDLAGNGNNSSNTLNVTYTDPGGGSGNCPVVTNVALNKTASQSSDYSGPGAGPELAVDGNTSGNWWGDFSVSSTGWEFQPWWQVDLGETYTIDNINIWNRTDCCGQWLSDYYILISDVPFISGDLDEVIGQPGVSNYHQTTEAGTPTIVTIGRSGRYVRIQSSVSGFVALAEVEVMGCSDTGGGDTTPPNATLSTANSNVSGAFLVNADFSEIITGLDLSDFIVTNGTASNLNGNGIAYTFTVEPGVDGQVSIELPANAVTDIAGNGNNVSNTLDVTYTSGGGSTNCLTVTNLALNQPALQSSAYNGPGAGPELAVDGNTSGDWWPDFSVSSTNWESNPYWEVDLGDILQIEFINIWNRTDCCSDFLSDYYILVSDVPFTSGDLSATISQPGVSNYHETTTAGTPSEVNIERTGRYVRVQLNGTGFMALAEVEVMGCEILNLQDNDNSSAQNRPGVFEENRSFNLNLFPNPAEDIIVVEYETPKDGYLKYFISNSMGTVFEERNFYTERKTGKIAINIHDWPAGYYVFYIKMEGFRHQQISFAKIRD